MNYLLQRTTPFAHRSTKDKVFIGPAMRTTIQTKTSHIKQKGEK